MTNQLPDSQDSNIEEDPFSSLELGRIYYSIKTRIKVVLAFFVTAALVGLAYVLHSQNIYELSTIVAVEETFNPINPQEALLEFKVSSGPTGLVETRKALLKSYSHTVRVLQQLGWEVRYEAPLALGRKSVYAPKGYEVVIDRSHPQLLHTDFSLRLFEDHYELLVLPERGDKAVILYDQNRIEPLQRAVELDGMKSSYQYDEWVRSDFFSFKVVKKDGVRFETPEESFFHFATYNEQARALLKKSLRLETNERGKSSLMTIYMTGTNRQELADFLNATIAELRRFELEQKNVMAVNSIAFIDDQLEVIREKLLLAEAELQQFRSDNLIVNLSQESAQILEGFANMDKERSMLSLRQNIYQHTLDVLESERHYDGLSLPSFGVFNDPTLNTLAQELLSISAETQRARLVLEPSNPTRRTLERELEFARQGLQRFVENALSSTTMLLNKLEVKMESANVRISSLPATEQQMLNIQREYQVWAAQYELLLEKRAEAQLVKASNVPDTKVLEKAEDRQQPPVAPKKGLILLAAAFFGFLLPSTFFIIKDYSLKLVSTPDELTKKVKLTYLGIISHRKTANVRVVETNPQSRVAESFRTLRANLSRLRTTHAEGAGYAIAVTSSVSGEGKTFIVLNLGTALAVEGHRVLLVGADLRRGSLHSELELNNELGLVGILQGNYAPLEAVQRTGVKGLDLIAAGPFPPNPSELLGQGDMDGFMQWARDHYDYILFDTAPMLLVADVLRIIPKVDYTLYVFRSGFSDSSFFKEVNRNVAMGVLSSAGMLLNDVDYAKMGRYGYRNGYSKSGYYGNYYSE